MRACTCTNEFMRSLNKHIHKRAQNHKHIHKRTQKMALARTAFSRTKGVPVTDEEAARYPNRYFEFHLRVNRVDGAPSELISQREVELLRSVSSKLSQQYGVPVPLSYNAYKEGRQRFLNFRVGWCGADTATKACNEIRKAIDASAGVELMHVGKSHSEYVWYRCLHCSQTDA